MVFEDDGWIAGRGANKSDVYLFGYGLEYRAALKAFFTVSGPPPLIPRWSLGNWWSRYCELRVTPSVLANIRCVFRQGVHRSHGQVQRERYASLCGCHRY
jgi:hypothetical protein